MSDQAEPPADDHQAGGAEEQCQLQRRHVFVVNGAPDFLDLMRDLLQEEQYNVTTTNFVPRTFDQVAALAPDLLMVDVVVGERAGWDLLERLQEDALTRQIPVLVTASDRRLMERAEAQQQRYGGQRFFVKPFELDALLEAVQELIGGAAAEPESGAAS